MDILALIVFLLFTAWIVAWTFESIVHHLVLNKHLGGKHNDEWHFYHWWPGVCQWKRRKERK